MLGGGRVPQTVRLVPLLSLLICMELYVFSWNCQGYGNIKFPRNFRKYNREYKLDIIYLLETRFSESKADKIIVTLGFLLEKAGLKTQQKINLRKKEF